MGGSSGGEVIGEAPWTVVRAGDGLLDALKTRSVITAAMDCIVSSACNGARPFGVFIRELEDERTQGLCSLETKLEDALRENGMNMEMWEELSSMRRYLNRKAHPHKESRGMREAVKRFSDTERRTWGTLDAAMKVIGI